MEITAALVKELRERTSAGMMECKKALQETNGDIEAAAEYMRKTGMAKADKKSGRVAAEGLIGIAQSADGKTAAIVEINSETDFVAKGDDFKNFVQSVADLALAKKANDVESFKNEKMANGSSVGDNVKALIAKIGENLTVRRVSYVAGTDRVSYYLHGSKIGVLVAMNGGSDDIGKDVAMHIAASKPVCVSADQVPAQLIEKEREIYTAQAAESGKPADIIEKMVNGRVSKFLKEVTLVGQPFVKDPDKTIEKLLKDASASVKSFVRFEVGEGIEKKTENFADEVMAQVKGS